MNPPLPKPKDIESRISLDRCTLSFFQLRIRREKALGSKEAGVRVQFGVVRYRPIRVWRCDAILVSSRNEKKGRRGDVPDVQHDDGVFGQEHPYIHRLPRIENH